MRIGGGIEKPYHNPEEWYQLVSQLGYRAVLSPVLFSTLNDTPFFTLNGGVLA